MSEGRGERGEREAGCKLKGMHAVPHAFQYQGDQYKLWLFWILQVCTVFVAPSLTRSNLSLSFVDVIGKALPFLD